MFAEKKNVCKKIRLVLHSVDSVILYNFCRCTFDSRSAFSAAADCSLAVRNIFSAAAAAAVLALSSTGKVVLDLLDSLSVSKSTGATVYRHFQCRVTHPEIPMSPRGRGHVRKRRVSNKFFALLGTTVNGGGRFERQRFES